MTSTCGGWLGLGPQRVALLDAEPVLLVDHDQAEVGELDPLVEQRVGADDDAGRAGGDLGQRRAAGRRAERAGDQRDPGAARRRRPARRPGPAARAGRRCRGGAGRPAPRSAPAAPPARPRRPPGASPAARTTRLARADLALQQPVHRVRRGQVGGDLLADARAGPSVSSYGSARVERVQQPAVARAARGRAGQAAARCLRCTSVSWTANASSHLSRRRARYSSSLRSRAGGSRAARCRAPTRLRVGPHGRRQRVLRRLRTCPARPARSGRSPRSAPPAAAG